VRRPPPPAPAPAPQRQSAGEDVLAQLVADSPAEEVPLEFAEEDVDQTLRPVATKGTVDIHEELEKLRTMTGVGATKTAAGGSKEVEKRLQDMLVSDRDATQEVKRKATLEVPAHLLKGSSAMKIHVAFDGNGAEQMLRDAITVKLVGNRRLQRLTLHIDLELKGK
jgi:hypothetical protein